jgi:diguanylate cyclase (GGDEF)-like protein
VLGNHVAAAATGLVVVLDVDDMSAVNARHGDDVGDRLLRVAETNLRGALSDVGDVVRLGGDQFLVVLPGQPSTATVLAMITAAFRRSRVRTRTARSVRVTASAGWARWIGTDAAGVVPAAGARLVAAKAARHGLAESPSDRAG